LQEIIMSDSDDLNELTERLRLIHGMTPAEAQERCEHLLRALNEETVALLNGTMTPEAAKQQQRERAQELRLLEYELKRLHAAQPRRRRMVRWLAR
jgi:hypothetical protein